MSRSNRGCFVVLVLRFDLAANDQETEERAAAAT